MFHCDRDHYDLESNIETIRKIAEMCLSPERIVFEMTQIVLMRDGGKIRGGCSGRLGTTSLLCGKVKRFILVEERV